MIWSDKQPTSAQRRCPGNVRGIGQRIPKVLPAAKAALQRSHTRDAEFLKLLCHTGTGGFIGSSTVEDDLLVFRKHVRASGDFIGQYADSSRQGSLIGKRIKRMAQ